MKVGVILGAFSIGTRPLDFWYNNIWDSARGLTGTDLCFVKTAQILAQRGHEVHLFTVHAQPAHKPDYWENVKIHSFEDRFSVIDDSFDGLISINEPDVFRGLTTKPVRIVWQMLNDFPFCQEGFDDFVDHWFGVCNQHTEFLKKQVAKPEKWQTLPLGCSPEWYQDQRVPGRVIWCSSADRGLHVLLSQWPLIKKAVPHATLKIFYHFNYSGLEDISPHDKESHFHVVEMGNRIRYIKYAIDKLKNFGVEHVGSISREQMKKEFSEAAVFAFSCDTVAFSEGFSVSTLEAHASFTVPVITSQDCLGSIYQDSGAIIIPAPVKDHLPDYTQAVIKSLLDTEYSNEIIKNCRNFAENHTWEKSVSVLESTISAGK
jgi:glycosyltransferase involved in cell wall biosynthesis